MKQEVRKKAMGCSNCIHANEGRWVEFCQECRVHCRSCEVKNCGNCKLPPSNYAPKVNTIFEKVFRGENEKISEEEYYRFLLYL